MAEPPAQEQAELSAAVQLHLVGQVSRQLVLMVHTVVAVERVVSVPPLVEDLA